MRLNAEERALIAVGPGRLRAKLRKRVARQIDLAIFEERKACAASVKTEAKRWRKAGVPAVASELERLADEILRARGM